MQKEKKKEKKEKDFKEKKPSSKNQKNPKAPETKRKSKPSAEKKTNLSAKKKAQEISRALPTEKRRRVNYKRAATYVPDDDMPTLREQKKRAPQHERLGKLKVASLGGLGEVGKNITLLEYGNDIILVDY